VFPEQDAVHNSRERFCFSWADSAHLHSKSVEFLLYGTEVLTVFAPDPSQSLHIFGARQVYDVAKEGGLAPDLPTFGQDGPELSSCS